MKNIWTWLPFWTRVWCWAINTCRIRPLVKTVQLANCRICTRSSKEMSKLLHLSSPQLKTRHGMKWDQSVRSVTCPYSTWCCTALSWAYPGLGEDLGSCRWLLSAQVRRVRGICEESWKGKFAKTNFTLCLFLYSTEYCYCFTESKA